jgi:hypothetical protein
VKSPEDKDECTETLIREKTMVEVLLRKYGFGSWTRPHEVKCPFLIVNIQSLPAVCSGGASEICCF